MNTVSIGMVLNQLIKEANLSAIHIAERLGKTRQNVYMDLKRTAMRDEQVGEYAKALGIDKQVIYDRVQGTGAQEPNPNYLQDYLKGLEEKFDRLLNQLETKDRQIEKLMDLLGKLDPDVEQPKELPFVILKNVA